jgi:hypothetical protein
MTVIRPAAKAAGLLDALGEKSGPPGLLSVTSPGELKME